MGDTPSSRSSLLLRIRDTGDAEAWAQFVDLYGPLIYRFGRKHGLQDSDAADLTQNVLRAVGAAARRFEYDKKRGTFRSWLFTVARNELYKWMRGRNRTVAGSGDSNVQALLEQVPGKEGWQADWDRDYERQVLAYAVNQVRNDFRDATWEAFWQTAVQGRRPKDVGEQLQMSVGAVYVAKSRVLARIKQEVRRLQAD
jgi:RNA polymerase sigma factor (sigma-70 family)